MMAGAAPDPQRREAHGHGLGGLDRRDHHLLLQPRAAVAARGAVDLDHALRPSSESSARATATVPPVIFSTSPGSGADAHQVDRRQPRDGVADVLDARLRDAKRDGRREGGVVGSVMASTLQLALHF